jgi:radical SAM protein with 4Fe4S-binding SPASM domain
MTSKCNFNCRHCYAADWFKEDHVIDLETTKSLVDQAIALGCQKVTFTGGEPLLTKATIPAMKYCIDKGVRVELESNGVFIEKVLKEAEGYVEKIEYAISYEGDEMRDKRFTPKVLENIRTLANRGCNVKIQTVITPVNIDIADELFLFSKNLNARHRVFLSHSPNGNGRDLPLIDLERWLKFLKYVRETYTHIIIELPDLFSGGAHKKCGWGVHRCEVMSNGDVTSCGPITFNVRNFVAGNIKDQPLEKIWNSPHFEQIRNLKQQDYEMLCARCPYWTTCLGACRSISRAADSNHKLLAAHPFCVTFYKALKEKALDPALEASIPRAKEWFAAVDSPDTVAAPEKWQVYNELMNTPSFGSKGQVSSV